jgi:hypothetical protein
VLGNSVAALIVAKWEGDLPQDELSLSDSCATKP